MDQVSELTFIYRSDKESDNKIRAFVESLPGYVVKLVDLVSKSLSERQLIVLAHKMKVHIEDLVDPASNDHIGVHHEGLRVQGRKELLSLLAQDSKILQTPFVVIGNKASKFESASKLFRQVWHNQFGNRNNKQ